MSLTGDNTNFSIKIINNFDIDEFDRLYDDCKNSIRKNLSWPPDIQVCEERKKYLESHYRGFFGYNAKLQGKFVYGIYHNSDPTRVLMYCSAIKNTLLNSLQIEITMFGKNKFGSKSWVKDFYTNSSDVMKEFTYSLRLQRWFYSINSDSDFANKNLYAVNGTVRDIKLPYNKLYTSRKIITSTYGW